MSNNKDRYGRLATLIFAILFIYVVYSVGGELRKIRDEIDFLDQRAQVLEDLSTGVLATTCMEGDINGPEEVDFLHPQILVDHTGFPYDHWLEIVVFPKTGEPRQVRLVAFSQSYEWLTVFDGYLGDIRGEERNYHILNPDAGYILRVWKHQYEGSMPLYFEDDELVFQTFFKVPVCR